MRAPWRWFQGAGEPDGPGAPPAENADRSTAPEALGERVVTEAAGASPAPPVELDKPAVPHALAAPGDWLEDGLVTSLQAHDQFAETGSTLGPQGGAPATSIAALPGLQLAREFVTSSWSEDLALAHEPPEQADFDGFVAALPSLQGLREPFGAVPDGESPFGGSLALPPLPFAAQLERAGPAAIAATAAPPAAGTRSPSLDRLAAMRESLARQREESGAAASPEASAALAAGQRGRFGVAEPRASSPPAGTAVRRLVESSPSPAWPTGPASPVPMATSSTPAQRGPVRSRIEEGEAALAPLGAESSPPPPAVARELVDARFATEEAPRPVVAELAETLPPADEVPAEHQDGETVSLPAFEDEVDLAGGDESRPGPTPAQIEAAVAAVEATGVLASSPAAPPPPRPAATLPAAERAPAWEGSPTGELAAPPNPPAPVTFAGIPAEPVPTPTAGVSEGEPWRPSAIDLDEDVRATPATDDGNTAVAPDDASFEVPLPLVAPLPALQPRGLASDRLPTAEIAVGPVPATEGSLPARGVVSPAPLAADDQGRAMPTGASGGTSAALPLRAPAALLPGTPPTAMPPSASTPASPPTGPARPRFNVGPATPSTSRPGAAPPPGAAAPPAPVPARAAVVPTPVPAAGGAAAGMQAAGSEGDVVSPERPVEAANASHASATVGDGATAAAASEPVLSPPPGRDTSQRADDDSLAPAVVAPLARVELHPEVVDERPLPLASRVTPGAPPAGRPGPDTSRSALSPPAARVTPRPLAADAAPLAGTPAGIGAASSAAASQRFADPVQSATSPLRPLASVALGSAVQRSFDPRLPERPLPLAGPAGPETWHWEAPTRDSESPTADRPAPQRQLPLPPRGPAGEGTPTVSRMFDLSGLDASQFQGMSGPLGTLLQRGNAQQESEEPGDDAPKAAAGAGGAGGGEDVDKLAEKVWQLLRRRLQVERERRRGLP